MRPRRNVARASTRSRCASSRSTPRPARRCSQIAPLPSAFSHSQFRAYEECGLRYAFERIYRIPSAETKGFFEFGSLVHATFEEFVKRRREARAAGEPEPTFEDLKATFDARWTPDAYTDAQEAQHYQRRSGHLLERFYERELASLSEAIGIEKDFTLELDPPDDGAPIKIRGVLDRIDRHPDGSIEVLDYKTGSAKSQRRVDKDEQLTTYALALAKGAVIEESTGEPIPAASKLTLYFTESDQAISTTRTPEQLAEHEAHLVETRDAHPRRRLHGEPRLPPLRLVRLPAHLPEPVSDARGIVETHRPRPSEQGLPRVTRSGV